MSGGEVKVTYTNIDQALKDIEAIQSVASEHVSIDLGMEKSAGAGASALQVAASSLSTVALSLSELLGRSHVLLSQSRDNFQFADEESAAEIEEIG